jgi:hypothetical protein
VLALASGVVDVSFIQLYYSSQRVEYAFIDLSRAATVRSTLKASERRAASRRRARATSSAA